MARSAASWPAAAHDSMAAHWRTIPVSPSVSAPAVLASPPPAAASSATPSAAASARTAQSRRARTLLGESRQARAPAGRPARLGAVTWLPSHGSAPFEWMRNF